MQSEMTESDEQQNSHTEPLINHVRFVLLQRLVQHYVKQDVVCSYYLSSAFSTRSCSYLHFYERLLMTTSCRWQEIVFHVKRLLLLNVPPFWRVQSSLLKLWPSQRSILSLSPITASAIVSKHPLVVDLNFCICLSTISVLSSWLREKLTMCAQFMKQVFEFQ